MVSRTANPFGVFANPESGPGMTRIPFPVFPALYPVIPPGNDLD
jgi:hypothetical protein